MGICGTVFENFKLGKAVAEKKATFTHQCSKCGQVDTIEAAPTKDGLEVLNFDQDPGSKFKTLCMWK
jgi:hypothetical protein